MLNRFFHTAATALALSALSVTPALAQDDDDDLGDILGTGSDDSGSGGESTRDEREAVERGETDERSTVESDEDRQKRVIKTLQKKTFMKIGRYEAAPHIGFVSNDPFINRYIIGAGFAAHLTEVFAIEAMGSFSPDFGEGDWKPITHQLIEENQVSPDISKIMYFGNVNFQFSPIYGKVAIPGGKIIAFDIFGAFGTGVVNTKDDLTALQCETDPACIATAVQFHPTTNFGGGVRVVLNENIAVRIEGRSLVYIETIASTTLEMKNNFLLLGGVSFFFPGMD